MNHCSYKSCGYYSFSLTIKMNASLLNAMWHALRVWHALVFHYTFAAFFPASLEFFGFRFCEILKFIKSNVLYFIGTYTYWVSYIVVLLRTHSSFILVKQNQVKEKTIAARRSEVKTIIFPSANRRDFDELTPNVKEGLDVHFVDSYSQIFDLAFNYDPDKQK